MHRTYDYAVSGTALLAIAAGIGVAIVALLDAATESPEISSRAADGQLFVAAITLLVVGVPLWLVTWLGVRRYAADNPAVELQSTTRRLYLFSLLGIGSIAAIVSLIGVVYVLLEDVLDGNFGARSISDAEGGDRCVAGGPGRYRLPLGGLSGGSADPAGRGEDAVAGGRTGFVPTQTSSQERWRTRPVPVCGSGSRRGASPVR